MRDLQALAEQLERQLRLETYPIAAKLLEPGSSLPDGTLRPVRDLGRCLATCQALAMTRRRGVTIAQLLEDMWCPEPALGYGLAEAPAVFLEGHNRYPRDVASLSAGAFWAGEEFPRLPTGKFGGILSAPLRGAEFEPDAVIIYCTPAQLTILLLAAAHREGRDVHTQLSGHAACVYAVVPPLTTGDYQVAAPCMGDRRHAMAADDEMIFALPAARAPELLQGLLQLEETERRIPFGRGMELEYELMGPYAEMAAEIGLGRAGSGSETSGVKT